MAETYASKDQVGVAYLDIDPVVEEIPRAVGTNSPRVLKTLSVDYSDNSLATAVSDLGTADVTLLISENTTVPNDLTIPSNIRIRIQNGALISVNSSKLLTILAFDDPGSVKCFTGAGKTVFGKNAIMEMNLSWWAGISSSSDESSAFEQARLSLVNGSGGLLSIPAGVWKVSSFAVPSGSVIQGAGSGVDSTNATVLLLANLSSTGSVLSVPASFRNIVIRDLTISTSTSKTSSCIIISGTAPNTSAGIELNNVTFYGAGTVSVPQVYVKDLGGTWEVINVRFSHCTWIVPPAGIGFQCDTPNCSLLFDQPFFYTSVQATNIYLTSVGSMTVINPTHNGIGTVPCINTIDRTVSASIAVGTKVLSVPGGGLTLNDVGQKVVISGKLDSYITGITSATDATVEDNASGNAASESMSIYRSTPASNTSLNRTASASITSGSNVLTLTSGSFDVTTKPDIGQRVVIPGKLDSYIRSIDSTTTATVMDNATATATNESLSIYRGMAKCAYHIAGSHGCINIVGSQDEGFQYFIINEGSQLAYPLSLVGNNVQATIRLDQSITINSCGNHYYSQTVVTGSSCGARISSTADYVKKSTINIKPSNIGPTLLAPMLFGERAGEPVQLSVAGSMEDSRRQEFRIPTDFKFGSEWGSLPELDKPVLGIGSVFDKKVFRIGRLSSVTDEFDYWYDIWRDFSTGFLKFAGNQSGYKGYDFDSRIMRSSATDFAPAATITFDAANGDRYTYTPNQNTTINALYGVAGQKITLKIVTSATSYQITFGSGIKSQGVLTTGTVSAKVFMLSFEHDGTNFVEIGGRGGAM